MRVLPIIQSEKYRVASADVFTRGIVLPVFRASAVAWAAAKYPAQATELASAASASAAFFAASRSASAAFRSAASAAADAADAVAFAAYAAAASRSAAAFLSASAFVSASAAAASAAFRSASAAAAAFAFRSAFAGAAADVTGIDSGVPSAMLASQKLWAKRPPEIARDWKALKKLLLSRKDEHWEVWTDWYEARLNGKPANEALEIARAMIPDEIWKQGPAVANAEIKRLIELHTPKVAPPIPASEPGPVIEVTSQGLDVIPQPIGDDFDEDPQKNFHARLQRLLPMLANLTRRSQNEHPELDFIVLEYANLIGQPFDALDINSLWAVGTGLIAFSEAHARRLESALTAPLEPTTSAMLQQAAQIHGGFILGFARGRELIERADKARLSPEILGEMSPAIRALLDKLKHSRQFVTQNARQLFAAVEATQIELEWQGVRAGYVGYVVARNALIAVGKICLKANNHFATVAGSIVLAGADPGLVVTQQIIQFVLGEAQNIASFVKPFPELKVWFDFIFDHISKFDKKQ